MARAGLRSLKEIHLQKKQRSRVDNSGLGSLDYQKRIFTGLGSLDFSKKKFRRSWIAKSGF